MSEWGWLVAYCRMQPYFSYICDGTYNVDLQADWRSLTYGLAPNDIDMS